MATEELGVKISVEGFGEFESAFKKMDAVVDGAASGNKKMGLSLTDLKSGLDLLVGGFRAVAQAGQQAFEFLQEGAQVLQLGETVKSLNIDLDALRAASGGTVDDMTLISGAAKLLAGTTGILNERMADAAPRLLEVARAAVKLDPTIGDVAFVYESLARGIKKNQPLLIDNANIIVKVSTAQEKLAASLGKSVAALTDEEKAVALLEATLEGGANMIEQMGGKIDGATDSYAMLQTQIKNTTDILKAQAAEAAGPVVSAWAKYYQALDAMDEPLFSLRNSLESVRIFLTGTSNAAERYSALLEVQATAAERAKLTGEAWARTLATANDKTIILTDSTADSNATFDQYSTAMGTANTAVQGLTLAQTAANESAVAAQIAFNDAAAALDEMTRAAFAKAQIDALKQSLDEGKISSEDFATAQEAILIQFGLLTPAEKSAQGSIETLRQAFLDGKISAETFALAVAQVKTGLDGLDGRTVTVNFDYRIPAMPNLPGSGQPGREQAYQHGGTLGSGAFVVGERGPELITGWRGGGNVLSNPTAARMLAQNNTTNNYNLTTNSTTRAGGLALEFATMEMGSR